MRKIISVSVFIGLAFLGAGCSKPIETVPEQPVQTLNESAPKGLEQAPPVEASSEQRLSVKSEADFLREVMDGKDKWLEYANKEAGVSFQYPKGFFTEPEKYGDQSSGMRFGVYARPSIPDDGVCDEQSLGDIDCSIAEWPKRLADFERSVGTGHISDLGTYEGVLVAQQVRTIHGMKFIQRIEQGMNGACNMLYLRKTSSSNIMFTVNICDDSDLDQALWTGSKVNDGEKLKAEKILAGKEVSESTSVKVQAMERVLGTLKMK